jgi:putative transposase
MVQYRRNRIAGATYFFTVAIADRGARLLVDHVDLLRQAVEHTRLARPFYVDAMVVLPDHLHAVWTLPEGDADYAGRWSGIKAGFTHALSKSGMSLQSRRKGEFRVWQSRYWEHTVRDEDDLRHHVEYIWFNPVKHGHARRVEDWPHSSFHRAVREGIVTADWGREVGDERGHGYGERPNP